MIKNSRTGKQQQSTFTNKISKKWLARIRLPGIYACAFQKKVLKWATFYFTSLAPVLGACLNFNLVFFIVILMEIQKKVGVEMNIKIRCPIISAVFIEWHGVWSFGNDDLISYL